MIMRWTAALGVLASTISAGAVALGRAGSAPNDPTIVAVGDIACDRTAQAKPDAEDRPGAAVCQERATSAVVAALSPRPVAILPLGDLQYPDGTVEQFRSSFAKSWGALGIPIHPVPGNHEYHTHGATGYYAYFGSVAGDPAKGYYSYDIGSWHLVAINANCKDIGGCQHGSPEEQWLAADLAAHRTSCTLAYWHQPRFSSGHHHSDSAYTAFWDDLYAAGTDVVLDGHDHDYERFGPQTAAGVADTVHGIREFVVGTGGKSHYQFTSPEPNSEVRNGDAFGVLVLTLGADHYAWRFVSVTGATPAFSDHGETPCHALRDSRPSPNKTP